MTAISQGKRITLDELAEQGKPGDVVVIELSSGAYDLGIFSITGKDNSQIFFHSRNVPQNHPDKDELMYHRVGFWYQRFSSGLKQGNIWHTPGSRATQATHCIQYRPLEEQPTIPSSNNRATEPDYGEP